MGQALSHIQSLNGARSLIRHAAWQQRVAVHLRCHIEKGLNRFHGLFQSAKSQPEWEFFQYTTAEGANVSPQELESAARALDERTYRQEFLASFAALGVGRAYHAFDRAHHVQEFPFNPHLQLCDKSDPGSTHVSDALGYLIAREFRCVNKGASGENQRSSTFFAGNFRRHAGANMANWSLLKKRDRIAALGENSSGDRGDARLPLKRQLH